MSALTNTTQIKSEQKDSQRSVRGLVSIPLSGIGAALKNDTTKTLEEHSAVTDGTRVVPRVLSVDRL